MRPDVETTAGRKARRESCDASARYSLNLSLEQTQYVSAIVSKGQWNTAESEEWLFWPHFT